MSDECNVDFCVLIFKGNKEIYLDILQTAILTHLFLNNFLKFIISNKRKW